ncbi:MAG: NAD(P)-dependent oxidoreductase [Candidatus Dormibacteraeota bacterium]|nr:NAD(P)-dependent oxidoreductase [Candidatus Dormibacteraeota bacterium]
MGAEPLPVGFLGLGAMGAAIVRRLLEAGHQVTGWNRSEAKAAPLSALGMRWAASPRELAAGSDVMISILTDAKALEQVVTGPDGVLEGLRPRAILADMSTISPDSSVAVASKVAEGGGIMLDTPISASLATLEAGNASIMVGGDADAYEQIRPILLAIGPKVTHIGANGHALYVKLAINLALVVQVISFCEGVALTEKAGIKRDVAVDAFLKSVVASPVLGYRGPFILEGRMPETAWADVNLQQKDLLLVLELGRKLGVALPTCAAANELLNAARGMGLQDRDFAVVYEVYRALGGMR